MSNQLLMLDYLCEKYSDHYLITVKVPDSILLDIGTSTKYYPEYATFSFDLKNNLKVFNEKNSLICSNEEKNIFSIPDLNTSIIKAWASKEKFYITYLRDVNKLTFLQNESLYNIGTMGFNL